MVNNEYLLRMGVLTWRLREDDASTALFFLPFSSQLGEKGVAIFDSFSEPQAPSVLRFMNEVLWAVGFISESDTPFLCEAAAQLQCYDLFVTFGQYARDFALNNYNKPSHLELPHPSEVLASPLTKKAIWMKLRSFTWHSK